MVLLGLNSALATLIAQAYGLGKLQLCGQYVSNAHFLNMVIFVPMAAFLANMGQPFRWMGQDPIVVDQAEKFIWASLPHIIFAASFEVQKHQLNS